MWGNSPDVIEGPGIANVIYSNIEGDFPGTGNINAITSQALGSTIIARGALALVIVIEHETFATSV